MKKKPQSKITDQLRMPEAEGLNDIEFEKIESNVILREQKIAELVRDLTDAKKDKPNSKRP
jgi:hypothetical protein